MQIERIPMLNRKTYRFAVLAMAVGLMAPLARADEKGTAAPSTSDPNPSANAPAPGTVADRDFVIKAATGNLVEVKLGEIAQQKASASDVKQFGQHMVDDHGKANDAQSPCAAEGNQTSHGAQRRGKADV
jgi:predicted outer membrane protein